MIDESDTVSKMFQMVAESNTVSKKMRDRTWNPKVSIVPQVVHHTIRTVPLI